MRRNFFAHKKVFAIRKIMHGLRCYRETRARDSRMQDLYSCLALHLGHSFKLDIFRDVGIGRWKVTDATT